MEVKTGSILLLPTKLQFNIKDRHYLKVKGWNNIFKANGPKKKAGTASSTSTKIDVNKT